jgi:hypothetical protein
MRTQSLIAKPEKYARGIVEGEVKTANMAELLMKLFGKDY